MWQICSSKKCLYIRAQILSTPFFVFLVLSLFLSFSVPLLKEKNCPLLFITTSNQILVWLNWRIFINLSKWKNKWSSKYLIKLSYQIFLKDKQYLFLFWIPCHGRKGPINQGLSVLLFILSCVQKFSCNWHISFSYIWHVPVGLCVTEPDFLGKLRYGQKWPKMVKKNPKMDFLIYFENLLH